MNIGSLILNKLSKRKEVKVSDIVKETGFSRTYVNRFFKKLKEQGRIVLIGKANQARYVLAQKAAVSKVKKKILKTRFILKNRNLTEDRVLGDIKKETGIFLNLPKRISQIVDYAFTEMLNNAIEHSHSRIIEIEMEKDNKNICFNVVDCGIGIFKDIIKKHKLANELEAIQELIKGKQTTKPEQHTGEGIFFTSKVADQLIIQGGEKRLIFNNILGDIFIKDAKKRQGTKVIFCIGINSRRQLDKTFREYAGDSFEFSKTKVKVLLFAGGADYLSRSQARRILTGLEKFKTITLDFKEVETIGQAFADEIFRVWQGRHPNIKIEYQNANENIIFMIKRAKPFNARSQTAA